MVDKPTPPSVLQLAAKYVDNPAVAAAAEQLKLSLDELNIPYQFGIEKIRMAGPLFMRTIRSSPEVASAMIDPLYTAYAGSTGKEGYSTLSHVTSDLFSDAFRKASLLHKVHVQTDMLIAILQAVGEEIEY